MDIVKITFSLKTSLMSSKKLLNDGESFYKKIRFRYVIKRIFLPFICICTFISVIYLDRFQLQINDFSLKEPTSNMTIFFIESKRPKDNKFKLNARQACALESAARHNPDFTIIMYTLNVTDLQENHSYMKIFREYPNIRIIPTTMKELVKCSFTESWIAEGKIERSRYRLTHLTDFLRFFLLYRYGGIYLDTDFIVFKSLRDLRPGWAVAENGHWVGSAALGMDVKGESHFVAEYLVREFMKTYNGTEYAYNGPGLLTRVAKNLCSTEDTAMMTRNICGGFEVLERPSFFPLGYDIKQRLIDPKKMEEALKGTKDSYAMHCWNREIGSFKLQQGSAIGVLAQQNCPKIFAMVDKIFR